MEQREELGVLVGEDQGLLGQALAMPLGKNPTTKRRHNLPSLIQHLRFIGQIYY